MIYLNNAATGWPKPPQVIKAVAQALEAPPETPFRCAGQPAEAAVSDLCRKRAAQVFGVSADAVHFTVNATHAANILLQGLPFPHGRVLVEETAHNAVLRPLFSARKDIVTEIVPVDADGHIRMDILRQMLQTPADLLAVNLMSNVTGAVQPLREICTLAHRCGVPVLADTAQAAGHIPLHLAEDGADMAIFTGHKGLCGPQGTGGFCIAPGTFPRPLIYGGTGTFSEKLCLTPEEQGYEAGTQNLPALHGLCAGLEHVLSLGAETIRTRESALIRRLHAKLSALPGVTVYPKHDPEGPLLSFSIRSLPAADAGFILSESFGIVLRHGLHCAPLLARRLKLPRGGTLRASVSLYTTEQEIDTLADAVRTLTESVGNV